MKQNSSSLLKTENYNLQQNQNEFDEAIFALLTEQLSGHMERWEYGSSEYVGDPAGGSYFWAKFIETTPSYYLLDGEKTLIQEAINSGTLDVLSTIKTVVELGPGSKDALSKKTIPFLSECKNLTSYIAVDSERFHAENAIIQIQKEYPNLHTQYLEQSFKSLSLQNAKLARTGLIMWGCTFGNIPGRFGSNAYARLTQSLRGLSNIIASGDSIFITFDTEAGKDAILSSYNQPLLSASFLSPLHRVARGTLIDGKFDPCKWRHESVWIPETMQCAHTIYPVEDQDFKLQGTQIFIPKGKRFITNNSYKFSTETMLAAASDAGFIPTVYKHDAMALLIAKKS